MIGTVKRRRRLLSGLLLCCCCWSLGSLAEDEATVTEPETPSGPYADNVVTCEEMKADPFAVFGVGAIDLGSGHGSPVTIDFDCEGGIRSLPFVQPYLRLAEAIRSEEQSSECSGSIVYAWDRYYRFALLGAGLAPGVQSPGTGLREDWDTYFSAWSHRSPSNFRLAHEFLATEEQIRPQLQAHFKARFGFSERVADTAARQVVDIVRTRAAGSFSAPEGAEPPWWAMPPLAKAVLVAETRPDDLDAAIAKAAASERAAALKVALLEHKSREIVDALLAGWQPDEREDETPLFFALDDPGDMSALLAAGADVNHQNGFGKTALYYAIEKDDKAAVEFLLGRGADPNHEYKSAEALSEIQCSYFIVHPGRTPLMHAAQHAGTDILALLLEHGAKLDAVDGKGFGAIDYAEQNGMKSNADYLSARGARPACSRGSFKDAYCGPAAAAADVLRVQAIRWAGPRFRACAQFTAS
ncbi:MAG: ankyrin repeat domain-containing protein [Gammaproteobacteria bacterium]|nr:ankyrin repeat domain-containing protein [Gammaproteobacteria bacterium]MBI5619058.1 ankyrin repeat domain-containing protein [Gammaproteobacteria bacterium]